MLRILFICLVLSAVCANSRGISNFQKQFAWTPDDVYETDKNGQPILNACWDIDDTLKNGLNPLTANPEPTDVTLFKSLVELYVIRNWNGKAGISFRFREDRLGAPCDIHIVHEDGKEAPRTLGLGRQLKDRVRGVVLNFTLVDWPYGNARLIRNEYGDYDQRWHIARVVEIALHEFGHVLGLDHTDHSISAGNCVSFLDPGAIMDAENPRTVCEGSFPQVSVGLEDIAELQDMYGENGRGEWKDFRKNLNPGAEPRFDFRLPVPEADLYICMSIEDLLRVQDRKEESLQAIPI